MADEILYCSFCAKTQHEVKKLIAGPTAFICDECVGLCATIVISDPDGCGVHWVVKERPVDAKELIKQALRDFREESAALSQEDRE